MIETLQKGIRTRRISLPVILLALVALGGGLFLWGTPLLGKTPLLGEDDGQDTAEDNAPKDSDGKNADASKPDATFLFTCANQGYIEPCG